MSGVAQDDWRAVIRNAQNIDWQTRLFVALKRARVSVVVGSGRPRAKSPTEPGTRNAERRSAD